MLLPATNKPTVRHWCGQMLVKDRPIVLRYAMAVFTVGIALGSASLLPWRADPSHFTLTARANIDERLRVLLLL
jgi:hypothetical protein